MNKPLVSTAGISSVLSALMGANVIHILTRSLAYFTLAEPLLWKIKFPSGWRPLKIYKILCLARKFQVSRLTGSYDILKD